VIVLRSHAAGGEVGSLAILRVAASCYSCGVLTDNRISHSALECKQSRPSAPISQAARRELARILAPPQRFNRAARSTFSGNATATKRDAESICPRTRPWRHGADSLPSAIPGAPAPIAILAGNGQSRPADLRAAPPSSLPLTSSATWLLVVRRRYGRPALSASPGDFTGASAWRARACPCGPMGAFAGYCARRHGSRDMRTAREPTGRQRQGGARPAEKACAPQRPRRRAPRLRGAGQQLRPAPQRAPARWPAAACLLLGRAPLRPPERVLILRSRCGRVCQCGVSGSNATPAATPRARACSMATAQLLLSRAPNARTSAFAAQAQLCLSGHAAYASAARQLWRRQEVGRSGFRAEARAAAAAQREGDNAQAGQRAAQRLGSGGKPQPGAGGRRPAPFSLPIRGRNGATRAKLDPLQACGAGANCGAWEVAACRSLPRGARRARAARAARLLRWRLGCELRAARATCPLRAKAHPPCAP
jgi:hypothetical protein